MTDWPLQDAQNQFGAVVDAALAGEPQRVTRRGKPAVVVLAAEEYERLCKGEPDSAPTHDNAYTFVDHLLAIPKCGDDDAFELPPRTRDFHPREIDF